MTSSLHRQLITWNERTGASASAASVQPKIECDLGLDQDQWPRAPSIVSRPAAETAVTSLQPLTNDRPVWLLSANHSSGGIHRVSFCKIAG